MFIATARLNFHILKNKGNTITKINIFIVKELYLEKYNCIGNMNTQKYFESRMLVKILLKSDCSSIVSQCSKKYLVLPWECIMIIADIPNFGSVARISFEPISKNVNRTADWLVCQCRKIGVLSFGCNFFLREIIPFL